MAPRTWRQPVDNRMNVHRLLFSTGPKSDRCFAGKINMNFRGAANIR